jgi:hypothetical protein
MRSGHGAASLFARALDEQVEKRRGRPRRHSEYEAARIREVTSHAELFEMRIQKLRGELLDRKLIEADLAHIFSSIRGIVVASKLDLRDKTDILNNLASIPVILENVAQKQNSTAEGATTTENGHEE